MRKGDTAWIIENGCKITQVEIIKITGNLYTIRIAGQNKGLCLPSHRIYPTREAAAKDLPADPDMAPGNRRPGLH